MWHIAVVDSPFQIRCSDGEPIEKERGRVIGESSRFIIDGKGFLDLTELDLVEGFILINQDGEEDSSARAIDANGLTLWQSLEGSPSSSSFALHLKIHTNGTFTLSSARDELEPEYEFITYETFSGAANRVESGLLKPLPQVSEADVTLIDHLIRQELIPYPEDIRGKDDAEIRALGQRLFPFSPYSFQLAMVVYDWTTASFARMVLLNLYRYIDQPSSPFSSSSSSSPTTTTTTPPPILLDHQNLARAIWQSAWGSYTPWDPKFMRSLLLPPCQSQLEVELQLLRVRGSLIAIADAENRLLAAAFTSLPRTSTASKPVLFSGQPDMSQLCPADFCLSLVECPLNRGPANSKPLIISCGGGKGGWGPALRKALESSSLARRERGGQRGEEETKEEEEEEEDSYLAVGRTVTTKTTWSFTDSFEEALGYSNGIILRAEFSSSSSSSSSGKGDIPRVWETASHITPLSNEDDKTEYTFLPGSRFEIRSVEELEVEGKGEGRVVLVIGIEPKVWELNKGR